MKIWRPIFVGMLLGTAVGVFLFPRGRKSRRIMAKVKRTINLLNDLGSTPETALRKQG